jgi:metal-responsive CopG/Arc/MetJ family transcriptional regulator
MTQRDNLTRFGVSMPEELIEMFDQSIRKTRLRKSL